MAATDPRSMSRRSREVAKLKSALSQPHPNTLDAPYRKSDTNGTAFLGGVAGLSSSEEGASIVTVDAASLVSGGAGESVELS